MPLPRVLPKDVPPDVMERFLVGLYFNPPSPGGPLNIWRLRQLRKNTTHEQRVELLREHAARAV